LATNYLIAPTRLRSNHGTEVILSLSIILFGSHLKLNLHKKALTLAGGLLLTQLIGVAILMWQIENAASSSSESIHSVFAIERSNWLAALLSATTLSCFAYRVTGDDQCFHIFEHGRNAIVKDMNDLSPVFNDNPDQRADADRAMRLITGVIGVLEETSREQPLPRNERMIQLVRLEILPKWNELYKLHDQLVAEQENKVREGPEHAQRARMIDLLCFVIFEAAAAATLAYLISKLLGKSSQAPLAPVSIDKSPTPPNTPAVKAEQEIPKTEKMFRVVTDTTTGSTDLRLHELDRLNKDLRTSLAAAQDALESVIEDHEDDLPPPAQRKLNDAHSGIARLLKQIHDLGPQQ